MPKPYTHLDDLASESSVSAPPLPSSISVFNTARVRCMTVRYMFVITRLYLPSDQSVCPQDGGGTHIPSCGATFPRYAMGLRHWGGGTLPVPFCGGYSAIVSAGEVPCPGGTLGGYRSIGSYHSLVPPWPGQKMEGGYPAIHGGGCLGSHKRRSTQ